MRVKICGIRSAAEADMALRAGADAIGFLIGLDYRTDDEISPELAADIIAGLPPFVSSVLVTHRTDAPSVISYCREIKPTTVQLHGEFPLEQIGELSRQLPGVKIVKAVHVMSLDSIQSAMDAAGCADGVLLDTKTQSRIGGTGLTHDWTISGQIVRRLSKPVILAGGLNPTNVEAAIRSVAPFGVDVNSGVENSDGSKSALKLEAFVRTAKRAGLS